MTDTVANLGFAVDSKPLDDAKVKLKDVSVQAKETGQAVDDFNQKASKLGTGVGNGTKQLAAGLSEAEKAATLAGTSINVLQSIAKRTGESISDVATRVAAARVGFAATAAASAELGTALNVVAPAAKSAAEGLLAKSFAVTELHTAIRAVSPVLNQFGGGLGTILSSATLVRGSFTLLAGVVGGELTIALARSADQITRNEKLFAALAGSVSAGKTALDRAKESARGSNIEFDTMAKAIQQTVQAQTDFANKSIIRARSSDEEANRTNKASDAMSTLGKVIRGTAANSKEANEIILAVSSSLQKTGKFGADELQRIRDISEPAAKELANIFGKNTVKEWADELARAPITADELIQKLLQVKPAVDAATKIDGLKTFDQAVTQLGIEWRHLLDALANTGAFSGVISAVSALAKVIELASRNTNVLAAGLAAIPGANAFAAGKKIGNFLKENIQANGGGGYDPSSDPFGAPMSPSGSSGNPFGDLYDSSTGGFDATDLTGFASGGSFVVGGDGGTDTTNVSFKATKGEVVTIATPDQAATAAALTPVSSTTDIEDLLKDQTKAIVDAINGLKTPSAVASSAGAAVAALGGAAGGGGVPAFGAGGSSGGGGGGSQTPFKKLEEEEKKREQELAARERELSGGGNPAGGNSLPIGLIGGQASALRGFLNHGSSLGQSIGKYGSFVDEHGITIGRPGIGAPTSGDDKGIIRIPQVEKNTSEANRRLNEANQSLDDVGRATASTTRGVESGTRDTVEAIGASSNTIASAISSALSSMGQSLMDQGGGSSGGFGGGSGSGGGGSSDYTGGAGFVDSFGLPNGGGFGGSSGSGSSGGFEGSSGGGAGNPFGDLYDPSTGGFDASNFVESSGSFARGGSFTVGGDGGTDTTPVRMFATRGERVTITPPGMRVSPAMLNPGSGGGGATSRTVQHVTNKKVTINVQAGISADTILRSRAQIARSM